MTKDHGPSIKNDEKYEALLREGMSKTKAARIANTPNSGKKGGNAKKYEERSKQELYEKAKEVGKPEEMLAKIAEGSVNKFLKEVTLLNQSFVKDEKVTIETLLKNNNAKIHSFYIYIVGDGIEKKEMDFASEVAAVSKA